MFRGRRNRQAAQTASANTNAASSAGGMAAAYGNDFTRMAPSTAIADDRAGKADAIELSDADIANTRFYGATHHREAQMIDLSHDVEAKQGTTDVMEQTVDALNARVGITGAPFVYPTLEPIRDMILDGVQKKAPQSSDPEARAWGEWLSESSRLHALLMPELNSEVCRREMKLDRNDQGETSDGSHADTMEEEDNVERVDNVNKRIFIGDRKRMDSMSNWINSGQTREIDGEQYKIYWTQESYHEDAMKNVEEDYHSWTPEMKAIHEESLTGDPGNILPLYDQLENAIRKKYTWSNSRSTKEKARAFRSKVYKKTGDWINGTVQSRFFRLTSLMGLDFFKNRGNMVQFARDIGQANFGGGKVNRVITDSEWAHTQRMGYVSPGGHVHRVNGADRFRMRR